MTKNEIINDALDKISEVLDEKLHYGCLPDIAGTMLVRSVRALALISDEDITPMANQYLNELRRDITEITSEIWANKQQKYRSNAN